VGFLVTVASTVAIVIMLYIGKLVDVKHRLKILQIGSVFYGLTWMFRQFAQSLPIVFVFDALTHTGKAMVNVPLVGLIYKIAGTSTADHAIAYAVFYEFSVAMGKIFTALVAIWILAQTDNIYYVFIFVGAMTMFYGLLRDRKR
jgi:MFS family permease